jgi:protoporphyrinogen/coproporphyrinogen III oxidase
MAAPPVIIGGGISGLSTAWYLSRAGIPSILIEMRPRLGGVIETHYVDGCVIEAGPDSFLSIKPAAMELIRQLGLEHEVIGSNDHLRKTYVWKRKRLVPLPDGLMLMIPTRIMPLATTRLLSWPTKIRMGLEWFRRARNHRGDQSVAEFVERHYGVEAVDYLAEPLLSGIYGGNPRALSVRSVLPKFVELEEKYGSLTRGVLAERRNAPKGPGLPLFRTLKGGLGQMVGALSAALEDSMRLIQGEAETVERSGSKYKVRVNGDWIETEHITIACEAHRAAHLLSGIDARVSELLSSVSYSSSMTVALGFDDRDFKLPLDGFGFLVPRKERKRLVACTWVGTKFPHRVPEGKVVLRCFLGGAEDAGVLSESDDGITEAVLDELGTIVGLNARPEFVRIARWPNSMAQYTVGHGGRISELESRLPEGLQLAGNAYHGIGIPDCIRLGRQAAEKIALHAKRG